MMIRFMKYTFIFLVLMGITFVFGACGSSDADVASADSGYEQDDTIEEPNGDSAEEDEAEADAGTEDDGSAVPYEDGYGDDGKIHVYLVGPGEEESSFDSSFIDYLVYYGESEHLIISMNGKEYVFANISESMWEDFKNADSKGKFYNANIEGRTEYHINDYDGTNGDLIVMEHVDP